MTQLPKNTPKKVSHSTDNDTGQIDPALLSLLVCPLTKQPLEFDRQNEELISRAANLAYPVRGGIAIMLPSEARHLDEEVR